MGVTDHHHAMEDEMPIPAVEYEQWVALGRPEQMPPQRYIVTFRWPGDEDRRHESYGPFPSDTIADLWVADCQEAASLGYDLLSGVEYVIEHLSKPFDPRDLMPDAASFQAGDTEAVKDGDGVIRDVPYLPGLPATEEDEGPHTEAERDAFMRAEGYEPAGDGQYRPMAPEPAGTRFVIPGPRGTDTDIELLAGHEYELLYRIEGVQRCMHMARMGYLGMSHGMVQFNARPKAGTQELRPEWIKGAVDQGQSSQSVITRRYFDRPAR